MAVHKMRRPRALASFLVVAVMLVSTWTHVPQASAAATVTRCLPTGYVWEHAKPNLASKRVGKFVGPRITSRAYRYPAGLFFRLGPKGHYKFIGVNTPATRLCSTGPSPLTGVLRSAQKRIGEIQLATRVWNQRQFLQLCSSYQTDFRRFHMNCWMTPEQSRRALAAVINPLAPERGFYLRKLRKVPSNLQATTWKRLDDIIDAIVKGTEGSPSVALKKARSQAERLADGRKIGPLIDFMKVGYPNLKSVADQVRPQHRAIVKLRQGYGVALGKCTMTDTQKGVQKLGLEVLSVSDQTPFCDFPQMKVLTGNLSEVESRTPLTQGAFDDELLAVHVKAQKLLVAAAKASAGMTAEQFMSHRTDLRPYVGVYHEYDKQAKEVFGGKPLTPEAMAKRPKEDLCVTKGKQAAACRSAVYQVYVQYPWYIKGANAALAFAQACVPPKIRADVLACEDGGNKAFRSVFFAPRPSDNSGKSGFAKKAGMFGGGFLLLIALVIAMAKVRHRSSKVRTQVQRPKRASTPRGDTRRRRSNSSSGNDSTSFHW